MGISRSNKRILAGVGVAILAGLLFGAAPNLLGGTEIYTVDGVVTWIDYKAHRASFEFAHPTEGTLKEKAAYVPAKCQIRIDGKDARFEDLKVGDKGIVIGSWTKRTKKVVPLSVRIERSAKSESDLLASTGSGE